MRVADPAPTPPTDRAGRSADAVVPLHLLAALLILAGVLVNIFRPFAPPITDLPDPTRWFDQTYLAQMASYRRPLQVAALGSLIVRLAIPVVVAATPWGRRLVGRVVDRIGPQRQARAAAVVIVAVLVGSDLILAPVSFWAGYLHEGAFGFRTSGLAGWAYDWAAVRAPTWVGAAVLAVLGYTLARRLPRAWPPVAGLAGAGLAAVVVFAGPYVLEPLMFSMEPLEPGPVRAEIETLLEEADQPIDRILVADASRRTTKHNAYVSGLGASRRVVLYDTLVADFPPEEIAMVMAHELGHHRNGDLPRGVALGGAGILLVAYALAGILGARVRRRRQESMTDPRAAAVVLAVVIVLNAISLPVQSALSRRAEAAADLAALNLTGDPETYVSKTLALARASLSDPDPPAWVHLLWSTHPTVTARLTMGERWPFDDGGQ